MVKLTICVIFHREPHAQPWAWPESGSWYFSPAKDALFWEKA